MERRGRAPARTSTYGQACVQCFKAKCRCVPNPTGGGCERCLRLQKDCQPSDAARRRNAQKAGAPDARIAQLEGKVDALLSALQAVIPSGSPADVLQLLSEQGVSKSAAGSEDINTPTNSAGTFAGSSTLAEHLPTPTSQTGKTPTAPPHSSQTSLPYPDVSPTEVEAEKSLAFFRSEMLPSFPFLQLPPTITANQIRSDRPILFQAIVTVSTFSTQRRLPRIEELKQVIFTSAFIKTQSNVDLLLAVLTYIAWSTDAFLGRADMLSRLMVLAVSLVYDLRLFKPSRPDVQAIVAYTQGFPENDHHTGEETVHGFMEQQRALLACFVLSSHISSHFGRIDALRWTPQLEDALQFIATNKSCPTDEIFAFQVRLQLLTHRASQVREQHETNHHSHRASDTASTATAPAAASLLYLNTLRAELQGLKASLNLHTGPPRQGDISHILAAYADYVQVYLDQSALSTISTAEQPILSTSGRAVEGGGGGGQLALVPGFERLECFWRSVEGIKSWLDHFYRMPPAKCVGLPSHFWAQTIWCNAILKHLSTHPDPALDCRAVRHRVNLLSTLDWMVVKLDMVSNEVDGDVQSSPGDNLFKVFSRLFSRARTWAEARWDVVPSQGQGGQGEELCQPHSPDDDHRRHAMGMDDGVLDVEDMSWMHSMDLDNDKWFEDVLGWSPANV
ncbi:hypothetical protein C8A03DRAFT_15696 [Achaetomium macrosporum]|uniref:Zn(2)-C6 fungal-type domain-containing protein n=1 Tax=Achaetomium macrosporum TaxID=79813 RepID=A0AAN7C9B2_9PEZI|nr:hypothetical protein C8A03DRAFT_15696 [Achaetomium macrosporum]